MNNSYSPLEPAVKAVAATALSESLSFCMERKYLQDISSGQIFKLESIPQTLGNAIVWININQVGKPLEDTTESCFTAIQKILYSCFLPKELQLIFLVIGDGIETNLYFGIKAPGKATAPKSVIKNLNEFIKGVWPGLQTEVILETDEKIIKIKERLASENFENVCALTGIPSMKSQYETLYPATIDKLIAGMNRSKNFAYMVVADPIANSDAEFMLHQCREMSGQAESLKSINVTEGTTLGVSSSHTSGSSSSHSTSHSESFSEAISKKDFSRLGKATLAATGLGAAASIFPAAGAVLEGCATTAGEIATSALSLVGFAQIGNIITGLMPQKTTTRGTTNTISETMSYSTSDTIGTNESKSQSLSRNIVNKHIEAVSEHLLSQSKRFEAGKAIGLWRVGVYLMADKKSDIQAGALQLRSILCGQESVFEPIRIHDISTLMDQNLERKKSLRELSLAEFQSPIIKINDLNGRTFNHPLGDNYKELKTVLTTKELSYLINFPQRSVPGLSVVDSSPEFCMNQQEIHSDDTILLGKLLYGGSLTDIPYYIPNKVLSRHTLLSGINGSGKTNTVQAILNGIGELPFLVIEPAKTEYVDWALEYNKNHPNNPIDIYIPGCKKYKGGFIPKPLKLNPFEIVWLSKEQEPNVLTHIDRLKSTFAAAFPMYDILPVLMEDLIYTVYQNKSTDWLSKELTFDNRPLSPTLNGMSISVDRVIKNRQYEERVERNMKACLNTRIDSLKRGWKGEMLNTLNSTPWESLFEKPCIINLSYVGDDVDKGFFMALILQFLYEYRTATAEIGRVDFNSSECKHLTIIEEAHRVMAKCDNQELPQYKSAMMFSNMLSEIRAYGEGLFLVDQIPTRLIPDAIKNTNTKITHRLVAEDDCKTIGEAMALSEEQRKMIAKLKIGQCIISNSLTTDTYWILANKVK